MRLKRIGFIGVILVLMAVAFIAGHSLRLERADGALTSWQSFWRVLDLVQNNFVEKTDDTKLMYGAIGGMLKALDDPYTRFMEPDMFKEMREDQEGHFDGVGMVVGLRDDVLTVVSPISGSPADKAGLKSGDQIIVIDGKETKGMGLKTAVDRIRGKAGTSVTMTIMRSGWKEAREFTLKRSIIQLKSVDYRMLDDNIGYAYLKVFNEKSEPELKEAIEKLQAKGMKSMVLDLRNDPGGLLNVAVEIAAHFMDEGVVVSIKERGKKRDAYVIVKNGDKRVAEYIEDYDGKKSVKVIDTLDFKQIGIPLVVLINEGSASASEIVAGAIQDTGRGKVIGTKSFGKGSVQSVYPLPDGSGLTITTAKYQTPKGRDVSRDKIVPDIEIKLTEEDVKNGKDAQLDKALELLKAVNPLKKAS
ncbi:MAG: S41 family peptidase [bacterium]|nr:S41 family peptidase [bacterium]